MSRVSLEANPGCNRKSVWGLKDEEYVADFCLVSRRTLSPREHRMFRYHFLLGADWKLCCRKLNLDRGAFFHEIYRIEQKLGRTFRELEPHALFPIDEYFNSTGKYGKSLDPMLSPFEVETHDEDEDGHLKPPLKNLLRFPIRRVA